MPLFEDSLKLILKYGIPLYKFGPFLSYVDGKMGLALKLKTTDFGYLNRNFSFDNQTDFEVFLKKYVSYKNAYPANDTLFLNNYKIVNPEIIYGSELEEQIRIENINNEKRLIEASFTKLKGYINSLIIKRASDCKLWQQLKFNYDQKLEEYLTNLHRFYDSEYKVRQVTESSFGIEFEKQLNLEKNKIINLIDGLKEKDDLEAVYCDCDKILERIETLEEDGEYFAKLYEIVLFKHKTKVLIQMNNFLLKVLKTPKSETPSSLKQKLDKMKNSVQFNKDKNQFVAAKIAKIIHKYRELSEVPYYNKYSKLKGTQLLKLEPKKITKHRTPNLKDLKEQYQRIDEYNQKCLMILFSPLRNVIDYIILNAKNDTLETANFEAYYDLYYDLWKATQDVNNVILIKEYFDIIDFTNFNTFISSLVDIAQVIYGLKMVVYETKCFWSLNLETELIYCSPDMIKIPNQISYEIKIRPQTRVLYAPERIKWGIANHDKLEIEQNDDLIIVANLNWSKKNLTTNQINDYKFNKEKTMIKGREVTIVTEVIKDKTYQYCTVVYKPKID